MPRKIPEIIDLDNKIGKIIERIRISMGITRNKLAELIQVTHQQLQKYERGLNRISAGRLYKISKVLNVNVAVFFEALDDDADQASVISQDNVSNVNNKIVVQMAQNFMNLKNDEHKKAISELVKKLSLIS